MNGVSNDTTSDGEQRSTYRRRTILRGSALAIGVPALSGIGSAQNETTETATETRITTTAVTLEQEDIEGDLVGMWIHFGPNADPVQASIADQCDIVDWGDQDTIAYDVKLIDRRAEPYEQSIELYLPRRVEVGAGDLFIINGQVPCRSGYVGIEMEQIGARDIDAGIDAGEGLTETEFEDQGDGPLGAAGPGFGVFAGATGLLGGRWILGHNRDE